MVKRASEGLIVRYGEGAAKIEGKDLARFATVLKEYLDLFDKVDKRLRDEKVTELLPKLDLAKHEDFEGDKKTPPKKIEKLERELKRLQKDRKFKSVESRFDEEHNLWEVGFTSSQGAEHIVNWELASSPEYRQMISKFKQIEPYMQPPFIVEPMARGAAVEVAAESSQRTVSWMPGRFFFIWMGVRKTSRAPILKGTSRTMGRAGRRPRSLLRSARPRWKSWKKPRRESCSPMWKSRAARATR